jgi:hypothetical protein
MKTVILRTRKRTKNNSFSDALFRTLSVTPSVGLFSKLITTSAPLPKSAFSPRLFQASAAPRPENPDSLNPGFILLRVGLGGRKFPMSVPFRGRSPYAPGPHRDALHACITA